MVLEVQDIKLQLRIRVLPALVTFINITECYGIIQPDLSLGERDD